MACRREAAARQGAGRRPAPPLLPRNHASEGEGRRKKRKEKREAENRERMELEAIEKGLDPTLVLDDSVVEIPQGATVAKFAEILGVQPNDIIKRLFMLGQVLA